MSSHDRIHWPQQEAHARAIVAALGPGWILRNPSHNPTEYQCWELHRPIDQLTLGLDWPEPYGAAKLKPARLAVALVWPAEGNGSRQTLRTPYGQPDPVTSISVDASKPAAAIAKDILRRLVPSAERLNLEALTLIKHAQTAASAQQQTVAALLAAEPGAHLSPNSGGSTIYLGSGSHGYTLRVDTDRSIRFEPFSVDLPAALRILVALRRSTCHTCSAAISTTQAALSMLRAEGAPARCADCISAELAERAAAEDPIEARWQEVRKALDGPLS